MEASENTALQPCSLCGSRAAHLLSGRSRDGAPLRTILCKGCGLGRVDPLPEDEALDGFYRNEYRQEYKGSFEPKPYHVLRAGRVALERLAFAQRWLREKSTVLDIGCGGGEFVYLLQRKGHRALGHEADVRYAAYARQELGVTVTHGPWSEIRLTEETRPDLVTLFHVLEHLPHPVEALTAMRGWLKDGGRVLVEVPNIEFQAMHPANRFHRAHLYHFNALTLAAVGECAGLKLLECLTSEDGGNLMAVFEGGPEGSGRSAGIPGNFERVMDWDRERAKNGYWFSPETWGRTLRRVRRQVGERWMARSCRSRRGILDHLTQPG